MASPAHAAAPPLELSPMEDVEVDVQSSRPGGDFAFRGTLRLRSVFQILGFVANGIEYAPEFDVAPDPRTGPIEINPRATLKIMVTSTKPDTGVPWMQYRDRYYSVADTRWDRETFAIQGHLFETAVGEIDEVGIPITISK